MKDGEDKMEGQKLKQKISDLETIISNLRRENQEYQSTIDRLESEQSELKENYEDQIKNLEEEIKELKLNSRKDNDIEEYREQIKKNKFTIMSLNREVEGLEKKNRRLQNEVHCLIDEATSEDTLISPKVVIKSSKKRSEIPQIEERVDEELIDDDMISEDYIEEELSEEEFIGEEWSEEETEFKEAEREEPVVTKGRVQQMIQQRNKAINNAEKSQEDHEAPGKTGEEAKSLKEESLEEEITFEGIEEKAELKTIKETEQKDHEPRKEEKEEEFPKKEDIAPVEPRKKEKVIITEEGKRTCPRCGNTNKRTIREMIDRTKIISAYPKMYGTKFKCGECGTEWR